MKTAQDPEPKSLGNSNAFSPVPPGLYPGNNPGGDAAWQLLLQVWQLQVLKIQKRKFLSPKSLTLLKDNFAHRAKVWEALAKDKEWQEKFISKSLPLIVQQKNEITYLVPWCKIVKPPKEGVYELATFQMKPGGPALWGEHFQKAVNTHIQVGYSKLIGVFHTEYGTLNRVHVLWWTETADSRAAGRHRSHEDARVVAAVRESCNHLKFHENMLLIPTPFSPLK
ncbi:protein NipSnap homolog 3A isoform X2 [Phascolarctos cinereus]